MKALFQRYFLQHWPRKLVALIAAIIIWFLVSESMTLTRTFCDVPIRLIHVPADKTIVGLQSNGLLQQKINLILTGKRVTIEKLHPSDMEVILDAHGKEQSWLAKVDKKNIISLVPHFHPEKDLSEVKSDEISITVTPKAS
jgi:hypothetical protein